MPSDPPHTPNRDPPRPLPRALPQTSWRALPRDSWRLLRPFWREALVALLRALPFVALAGFGVVWLAQEGWLLAFGLATAGLALAVWPLRRAVRRRAKSRATALLALPALPQAEVTARERQAEAMVRQLAAEAGPADVATQEAALVLLRRTVEAVAAAFHPGDDRAWARFTLPEALLLAEEVARGVRLQAVETIPGIERLTLGWTLGLKELMDRHGGKALLLGRLGYGAWRVARLLRSPLRAGIAEGQGVLDQHSDGSLTDFARKALAQAIVREAGRAAIRLYGGRLRDDPALAAAREAPLRLVVAGQPGAGRAMLVAALREAAGTPACPVALQLVEVPGPGDAAALRAAAEGADAVLWAAAATQPARAPDHAALEAIRGLKGGGPPVLLVLTRCDQLSPVREWSPPYDLREPPPGSKAATIRDALAAAAEALGLPPGRAVPVAQPPGAAPYNLEALVARVVETLPEARQRQLDRAMAARGLSLGRLLAQAVAGGKVLAGIR